MDKVGSRRRELREWMRARIELEIEAQGAVDVPGVVDAAIAAFESQKDFMRELIHEVFRPAAYQDARQIIAATRHEDAVEVGGELVARSEFEARARSRFARWVENVGRGRDVRLLDMSKEDCRLAKEGRRHRARHEEALAEVFGELEVSLDDDQRVRDVFSAEDIEDIYARVSAGKEAHA